MWTNTFTHPIAIGTNIQADIPPCITCQKIRSAIPLMPALQTASFQGIVDYVFTKNGEYWYRIDSGRLIEGKHVRMILDHYPLT